MWFSPLKGAHLTLGQLDKTLPVDTSVSANQNIERGSFVYINADNNGTAISPRFALYTATIAGKPNAVPYIALMGVNDFQAGMAGNVGQAPVNEDASNATHNGTVLEAVTDGTSADTDNSLTFLDKSGVVGVGGVVGPRITAISVVQPAEYQTTAFETSTTSGQTTTAITYYVGQPLTISDNGKLTPYSSGKNIVGYVTAVPKTRWINDLGASNGSNRISGGNAKVIEFSTAWIPAAITTGDDTNLGALNVKASAAPAAAKPAAPAPAAKPATPAK